MQRCNELRYKIPHLKRYQQFQPAVGIPRGIVFFVSGALTLRVGIRPSRKGIGAARGWNCFNCYSSCAFLGLLPIMFIFIEGWSDPKKITYLISSVILPIATTNALISLG